MNLNITLPYSSVGSY